MNPREHHEILVSAHDFFRTGNRPRAFDILKISVKAAEKCVKTSSTVRPRHPDVVYSVSSLLAYDPYFLCREKGVRARP